MVSVNIFSNFEISNWTNLKVLLLNIFRQRSSKVDLCVLKRDDDKRDEIRKEGSDRVDKNGKEAQIPT